MIKQTTDYDLFHPLIGNRQLNKKHIHMLKKEIAAKNLLEVCPIIVNEKMEVIDGQHRIEAAKQLGIAIPYVIVPGMGIQHVVRLNNVQRRWNIWDYIELHVRHKNPNYIQLKEFSQKYKISPSSATVLLAGATYTTTRVNDLREGRFVVLDEEGAEEVVRVIDDLRPFLQSALIARSGAFIASLKHARRKLEKQGMSLADLSSSYQKSGAIIPFSSRVMDYLREYEKAINYKKPMSKFRMF